MHEGANESNDGKAGLALPARCRSRTGFLTRVTVTALSPDRCRIECPGMILAAGDLVVIRLEGIEGICGRVSDADFDMAWIEFAERLYGPVVEHLLARYGGAMRDAA
ncbi:hypothetical protein GCM10011371_09300 [Novosphingobium marinum]|uniref:PilZ domain-containing protein n=1 Tax=Novosphingobium marinum TaxID=1514948 RepID=A0A7Y9XUU5_9SPHN|nr:PilZ domain-containing protein [Novosphingobium marinum]NYH95036.1 hypothetical protein [Novosphingobium marinum]GGC23762.1 hypothetical protein GCM10011371_09300 [Novosphingobium marinum]